MVPIRYRLLGDSGLRVSEIALGTMLFGDGEDGTVDPGTAARIFDIYRSAGGNFFDTADIFGTGRSEMLLGELINHDRDAVVLGTKYTFATAGMDPNAGGNHRKHLVRAVEASLGRLRTDRLDILWVNGWDFMTPEHEVMRSLDDLVSSGKVLYLGVANAPAWVVTRCNTLAQGHGRAFFIGLQAHYSLADRTAERDLLPMARSLDLGVIGCSPLNGGQIAAPDKQRRVFRQSHTVLSIYKTDQQSILVANAVATVAGECGCTAAQVALAWVRDRGLIPVIGASTVEQMTEDMGVLEVSLSSDQTAHLNKVSAIELGYPHDYLAATRGGIHGGMYERIDRHRDRGAGRTR